jgi:excisionase family DNA binding protein
MTKRKTNRVNEDHVRRALSVTEVAVQLGVSEALVRLEIKRELLKCTRFGRRILVMREELDRYLAQRVGR